MSDEVPTEVPTRWTAIRRWCPQRPKHRPPPPPPAGELIDKPEWDALVICYNRAMNDSESLEAYYRRKGKSYERYSTRYRRLTFFFAAIAALSSTVGGAIAGNQRIWSLELCVGSAALAGILLYAEQVFGWSTAWMRNVLAASEIAGLQSTFVVDWSTRTLGKKTPLNPTEIDDLRKLLTAFETDIAAASARRTLEWSQKFSAGNEALVSFAKDRNGAEKTELATSRKQLADEKERGAVSLAVTVPSGCSAVYARLDDRGWEEISLAGTAASKTWLQVTLGLHQVHVALAADGSGASVEDVVMVAANTRNTVSLTLPHAP